MKVLRQLFSRMGALGYAANVLKNDVEIIIVEMGSNFSGLTRSGGVGEVDSVHFSKQ